MESSSTGEKAESRPRNRLRENQNHPLDGKSDPRGRKVLSDELPPNSTPPPPVRLSPSANPTLPPLHPRVTPLMTAQPTVIHIPTGETAATLRFRGETDHPHVDQAAPSLPHLTNLTKHPATQKHAVTGYYSVYSRFRLRPASCPTNGL